MSRRGRPAKDPRDRRDQLVGTRISAGERVLLEAFCDAEGITTAEAIRLFTMGCLLNHRGREGILSEAVEWMTLPEEVRQDLWMRAPRVYREG